MSARDVIANTLMPGGYADAGTFAAADDVLHDLATAGYTVAKLHRIWWEWGNDEGVWRDFVLREAIGAGVGVSEYAKAMKAAKATAQEADG